MAHPRDRRRKVYTKEQLQQIKESKKQEQKKKESIKWHWSMTILVIGLLTGLVSLLWMSQWVVISKMQIILIIVGVGLVSFLVQMNYFKKKSILAETFIKSLPLFISYNIFGVGFLSYFIMLTLNMTVTFDREVKEYYDIVSTDPDYVISRGGIVVLTLEDNTYDDELRVRCVTFGDYLEYNKKKVLECRFERGLFGFKVIKDYKLVYEKPVE